MTSNLRRMWFSLPASGVLSQVVVAVACAQATTLPSERDRYERLKQTAAQNRFFPRLQLGKPTQDETMERFCTRAMDDIVSGKGVQPIEPSAQTTDVEDRRLKPWVDCWKNEEFIQRTGIAFGFGTQAFRLYRVDLDRNPKNGLEEVLYAEWDHKNPPMSFGARFTWMNTRTCTIRGGEPAVQRDTRNANGVGQIYDAHALLVRYRQEVWALQLNSLASTTTKSWADPAVPPIKPGYSLSLSTLAHASDRLGRRACTWSTIKRAT
jgi:hypothetical protein